MNFTQQIKHVSLPMWSDLAKKAIQGKSLSLQEALSVLQSSDDEILSLLHAAFEVRRSFFGKKVMLNMIINAKSGYCPEDCSYCSQSIISRAKIPKYTLVEKASLIEGAKKAVARKANTYCIVLSGRGPTEKEIEHVIEAVKEIKHSFPLRVCACLGLLKEGQAKKLKQAGVDRYNHNINTSSSRYGDITTTHSYEDRLRTIREVKAAGISSCSGVIIGMGETDEEIVDMAYTLRELDIHSIPINFLIPIPGTSLEKQQNNFQPRTCLKILCLFRFICADKEIRVSAGREKHIRSLQPLALYPANSIFIGDYLTTGGQEDTADHAMIRDLGFEIETRQEIFRRISKT